MRGEDRLEKALRSVGDDFIQRNPADLHRARERVRRLRRRRQVRAGLTTSLGAAAAVAVAVFVWPATDDATDRPRPAVAAELPPGSLAISVGGDPAEVAAGDGVLWVSGTADSAVSRVDPGAEEATIPVHVSGPPGDLAVGPDGEVWVAIPDLGVVQRIDPATNATVPDMRIEVGPEGTRIDLAIDDFLWVSAVDRALLQVDPASGEIVRRIDSVRPVNVAARDGAVFVLDSEGTVHGIDPLTGELNAIELSFEVAGPGDVHFHDGKVWVAQGDGSTLYSVDVADASRRIASYSFRGTYVEMAEAPGGVLVLSDVGDGTGVLTLIDPVTGTTRELAQIPGGPRDLARAVDDLWVTLSDRDEIVRIPSLP